MERPKGETIGAGFCHLDNLVILPWFYERMARALRIERPGGGQEGPGE